MRRALQRLQTAAADRWSFIEHPRLYRPARRPSRDWPSKALRWMAFGYGMLLIWGAVATIALIVLVTLIGWIAQ